MSETLHEMVERCYKAAEGMQEALDRMNYEYSVDGYAHFGIGEPPVYESPIMSRADFREQEARIFMMLLLKKEQANREASVVQADAEGNGTDEN